MKYVMMKEKMTFLDVYYNKEVLEVETFLINVDFSYGLTVVDVVRCVSCGVSLNPEVS
jgi:hypothetical protein